MLDDLSFLNDRPAEERAEWARRLAWIRLADQMAQRQLIDPEERRLDRFIAAFRRVNPRTDSRDAAATSVWAELAPEPAWLVGAFDDYLSALADWARRDLNLATTEAHDRLLRRRGSSFALLPHLSAYEADAILAFGALAHAFRDLERIMRNPSEQNRLLPANVLTRSRRTPERFRYWVDEHIPELRAGAARFLGLVLHPSVAAMRSSLLVRHAQLEAELRLSNYDPRRSSGEPPRRDLTTRNAA
jgi:phytoene synthase